MEDERKQFETGSNERVVIDYQRRQMPAAVTRGERTATLIGYGLLIAGFALLGLSLRERSAGVSLSHIRIGLIVLLAGAAVTGSCFIYNALRRL